MEEKLRDHILLITARYGEAVGLTDGAACRRAINDDTLLKRIRGGASFTVRTYDRIVGWFAANWPEDAEWPAEIERPERTRSAA